MTWVPQERTDTGTGRDICTSCSQQLDACHPKDGDTPSVHGWMMDEHNEVHPHVSGVLLSLKKEGDSDYMDEL